ncbi:MAG: tetratricopeptide repeat protein [Deltaproteobacteria bacterium]|nr:tetratricopeptide repeat protein [Deltaproteobacteria bacterium]
MSSPPSALAPVLKTLVLVDLVDSTSLLERLGDLEGNRVFTLHERMARDLVRRYEGREIDKSDGFLLLFDRPITAVSFALAYHRGLAEISERIGTELSARAAVHLGEVLLRENSAQDIALGAKPIEVEGLAKPVAARLLTLACGRQTLLTAAAFDLSRHVTPMASPRISPMPGTDARDADLHLRWLAHGPYRFQGVADPMEIFEVGVEGVAPLTAPPDSAKAHREIDQDQEKTLGWRPAPGLEIPGRPHWFLQSKLGDTSFGESWLASRAEDGAQRVFKFCYDAERLRALQGELALFRLLKEGLGEREDIARVLDWSLEEAPFFLEVEYASSGHLLDWARAQGGLQKVSLEQRLELVAQVAEGLAAAHSVGVLHQDLQPLHILIDRSTQGGLQARLTDFQLARDLPRSSLASPQGPSHHTAGTFYLAPEVLEGKAPDARADIYSLGVLLYQMTVGDFSRALATGWRRDVDPPLLSEDIAYCVDGEPQRRPESAFEIATRLRQLDQRQAERDQEESTRSEAEEARDALSKSRRRWRWSMAMVTLVTLFAAILGVQFQRAHEEAERANREAQTARSVSAFLVDLFEVSDPDRSRGTELTAREVLDLGATRIESELREQPEIQVPLMTLMGRIYNRLGLFDSAEPLLEGAHERARANLGEMDPEVANSLHELARLQLARGNFDQAEQSFQQTLELRRLLLGQEHPEVAATLSDLALLHQHQGRLDRAEGLFRQALTMNRRAGAKPRTLAANLQNLATVLEAQGDDSAAEPLLREALSTQQRLLEAPHPELAVSLNNLAVFLFHRGDLEGSRELFLEALSQKKKLLGEEHPEVAAGLNNLAVLEQNSGNLDGAEELFQQALGIYRRSLGEDHPNVATNLTNLGQVLLLRGKVGQAEALLRQALAIYRSGLPDHPWRTAFAESTLGGCLLAQERYLEAEPLLLRSYQALEDARGKTAEPTEEARMRLVSLYESWGREKDAAKFRALASPLPSETPPSGPH